MEIFILWLMFLNTLFWREKEIICTAKFHKIDQAILGAEIEVPTLTKNVLLKIPPETQTGKVFKLKDKGAGSIHGRLWRFVCEGCY